MPTDQVIHIHVDAPPMPQPGEPCNGCGVCCLAEPCPIGAVLSRRRTGACVALRWSDAERRYLCGVLDDATRQLQSAQRARGGLAPLRRVWARAWWRWVRRHIASGVGCDASLSVDAVSRPEQG